MHIFINKGFIFSHFYSRGGSTLVIADNYETAWTEYAEGGLTKEDADEDVFGGPDQEPMTINSSLDIHEAHGEDIVWGDPESPPASRAVVLYHEPTRTIYLRTLGELWPSVDWDDDANDPTDLQDGHWIGQDGATPIVVDGVECFAMEVEEDACGLTVFITGR